MPTLRELQSAIDAGAMVEEKDTSQRDTIAIYWEDGYYALLLPPHMINNVTRQGDDINAIFVRPNWAIGASFGYVDFEDLLADLGEPASIDKWRVAAPSLVEIDKPAEGWPADWPESRIKKVDSLIEQAEGHRKAWKAQVTAEEWKE